MFTGLETSELIKYAGNAFLAVKISYINQMADLCEVVGANVHDVAKGIGLDKRIGSKFLHPGPGYGGSCFPKDTLALVRTAQDHDVRIGIVNEVVDYNDARKQSMSRRVIDAMGGEVKGKTIAILGLAFKPETDDMRDSPSLDIIPHLLAAGANISVFDPKAMDEAKHLLPESVHFTNSAEDCINGADAVVLVTEWNEFRALTPERYLAAMKGRVMVDLRNIYAPEEMTDAGLRYSSIGR
jgi:UDPglucose 6-dehydrogenase